MALRKVLRDLSDKSCERGLIFDRPPIPFAITDSGIEDSEKQEITLRVDPKVQGNTFKKKVHVYGGGTLEDVLIWLGEICQVLRLKPCTTPQSKFEMTEALVVGDAKATWAEKIREVTEAELAPGVPIGKTELSYKKTLGEFVKHFFPKNAARIQISHLTHHLKKPMGLSVRECVSRIKEINRYLEDFPHSDGKQLSDFVLIDLLNKFVPRSWQED